MVASLQMNCSTVHVNWCETSMHLMTFLPHCIYWLKLFSGNKHMQLPANKATPWHEGFLLILKLRKGSFISLFQEEILLMSQASRQLYTLSRPFPGTNYPVLQASHYHKNFKRNSTLEGRSNHTKSNILSEGRQILPPVCKPLHRGLQLRKADQS